MRRWPCRRRKVTALLASFRRVLATPIDEDANHRGKRRDEGHQTRNVLAPVEQHRADASDQDYKDEAQDLPPTLGSYLLGDDV